MYIPLKRFQKKTLFIGDVSVNWATGRRWQVKLLDTWQVTQVNLPRQKSVTKLLQTLNNLRPVSTGNSLIINSIRCKQRKSTGQFSVLFTTLFARFISLFL